MAARSDNKKLEQPQITPSYKITAISDVRETSARRRENLSIYKYTVTWLNMPAGRQYNTVAQ
jgi:hypothetical protein